MVVTMTRAITDKLVTISNSMEAPHPTEERKPRMITTTVARPEMKGQLPMQTIRATLSHPRVDPETVGRTQSQDIAHLV